MKTLDYNCAVCHLPPLIALATTAEGIKVLEGDRCQSRCSDGGDWCWSGLPHAYSSLLGQSAVSMEG
jgi:hypothetical protein